MSESERFDGTRADSEHVGNLLSAYIDNRLGKSIQTQVREHLSELIQQIRGLNESETYRPSPYAECFFCDFKTLCPLFPEGQPVFRGGGST